MSTTERDALAAKLYSLIVGGHETADGPYIQGVVDFWEDSVDVDRLADGVIALLPQILAAQIQILAARTGREHVIPLADGRLAPKAAVEALDVLDVLWPGASRPGARARIVATVIESLGQPS